MDVKGTISVLFWLSMGVAVIFGSFQLGLGTAAHPRAGFMSFYAGILLVLLSIFQAIQEIRKGRVKEKAEFSFGKYRDVFLTLGCLLGYILVLERLGYLISITLLVFITLKMRSPKGWIGPLVWSICVAVGSYFVFAFLLECRLPRGIL